MRPRTLARRLALQYLFQADLTVGACESAEAFLAAHTDETEVAAFARGLVAGVFARRAEIDNILRRHAANYALERIAAVERNVLFLAASELLEGEAPFKVVINEAVKLARTFGGRDSGAFVNGILDAIAKEAR
ncbi:MAG: transcription antitermination factor NusB [Planctomycetota bacterium]